MVQEADLNEANGFLAGSAKPDERCLPLGLWRSVFAHPRPNLISPLLQRSSQGQGIYHLAKQVTKSLKITDTTTSELRDVEDRHAP